MNLTINKTCVRYLSLKSNLMTYLTLNNTSSVKYYKQFKDDLYLQSNIQSFIMSIYIYSLLTRDLNVRICLTKHCIITINRYLHSSVSYTVCA